MALLKVRDISIEHYVEGQGPPLLLLGGIGSHAHTWGEPVLKGLRERFQIVRMSNRGMGQSQAGEVDLTVDLMAEDSIELMKALGFEKAHVFGYSMGGYIAQELAIKAPEFVEGLVLGCTNCGPKHSVPQPPEAQARMGQVFSKPPLEMVREFCLSMVTDEFAAREPEFMNEMVAAHMTGSPNAFGRQMGAIGRFDSYGRLSEIRSKPLLIHGDADIVIPVENSSLLAERIPGSRLEVRPGVGHMFVWQEPEDTARLVSEHLLRS